MNVYLDNASTTKPYKEVIKLMANIQKNNYGNPSSLHQLGINADNLLLNSRKIIADSINAKPEQIIFTSGGTEANNLAIKGSIKDKKGSIITTKIEHPSVLNVFKELQNEYEVIFLNVDRQGFIDKAQLIKELEKKPLLLSIIYGNNEIGTIQDLNYVSEMIKEISPKTLFHVDACQSFIKTNIDVKELNIDLLTINGHKVHGPKGIGALFIKDKKMIKQINQGGYQEFNLRPGTENIPAISGFAKSVEIGLSNKKDNINHMKELQDYLIKRVLKEINHTELNGPSDLDKRLCNNINITFKFIEGESLLMLLNQKGIYVSTGSACSSQKLEPSHVILALGKEHEDAHGTIRFSLSKFTSKKEIDYTIKVLKESVEKLRKISHITKEV